ncbi:MAG TPA: hypothetical protein VLJ57_03865, partial [Burkholderiaceae bacterium]|nr:hypothetical protein [Burkholderiaceae bacterium]
GLMNKLTRHDPVLLGKLLTASANEPLLQAGSQLSAAVRDYLRASATKTKESIKALDPHAT